MVRKRAPDQAEAMRRRMADEQERWEVWHTPGHVVEQGLWAAKIFGQVSASRVLDLGAGTGVFGQRVARVFPSAERFGVEVRASERRHLRRHYHHHALADMFTVVNKLRRFAPKLVVSNPPYSKVLEVLALGLDVCAIGGYVLLFLRGTFPGSARAWQTVRATPPIDEYSVAGRPNMRRGVSRAGHKFGGDLTNHTWFLWRRGHRPRSPAWMRYPLPALASEHLRWSVLPGTERKVPEFPIHYMPEAA